MQKIFHRLENAEHTMKKRKNFNPKFFRHLIFITVWGNTRNGDYSVGSGDVKILAVPHKTVEEYEKMSADDLFDLAYSKGFCMDYSNPDEDNNKFVAENYVNIELPEGKYDLLFTYKGKVAYFINVNLTPEPTE